MNYRHAYHAGNFADVLKHSVLFALIEALQAKPTPFAVIDTHAGSGCYALDSAEAGKTGEYKDGIARLLYPDLHPTQQPTRPMPPLVRRISMKIDLSDVPSSKDTKSGWPMTTTAAG